MVSSIFIVDILPVSIIEPVSSTVFNYFLLDLICGRSIDASLDGFFSFCSGYCCAVEAGIITFLSSNWCVPFFNLDSDLGGGTWFKSCV